MKTLTIFLLILTFGLIVCKEMTKANKNESTNKNNLKEKIDHFPDGLSHGSIAYDPYGLQHQAVLKNKLT